MARKYDTVEIDGHRYELHGVKCDSTKIGFVPVRCFGDDDPFEDYVAAANDGEIVMIVADWKYGAAVRLQGQARKSVSGGGYTEADHNKIFNELSLADPNWLIDFAGKGDALDKACKAEWQRRKDENPTDTDESYVWEEYANTLSAEIEIS